MLTLFHEMNKRSEKGKKGIMAGRKEGRKIGSG